MRHLVDVGSRLRPGADDLDPWIEDLLEELPTTHAAPGLELGIGLGADRHHHPLLADGDRQLDDILIVAAIEAVGDARRPGELPHPQLVSDHQVDEAAMRRTGRRTAMVAGDQRHDRYLDRGESREPGVANQVERVLVMRAMAHVVADVVQQGGVLEELAVDLRQTVEPSQCIEQTQRQAGDLLAVPLVPVIASGELMHGSPARVRVGGEQPELWRLAAQVAEQDTFAQPVARRRLRARCRCAKEGVEQREAWHDVVDSLVVEARHAQALGAVAAGEVGPQRTYIGGGKGIPIAHLIAAAGGHHRRHGLDGARGADQLAHATLGGHGPHGIRQLAFEEGLESPGLDLRQPVAPLKPSRQASHAELAAGQPTHALAIEDDQLDAATADINDQAGVGSEHHAVLHRLGNQLRLHLAGDRQGADASSSWARCNSSPPLSASRMALVA